MKGKRLLLQLGAYRSSKINLNVPYIFLSSDMYKLQLSLTPSDIFMVSFGFALQRDNVCVTLCG